MSFVFLKEDGGGCLMVRNAAVISKLLGAGKKNDQEGEGLFLALNRILGIRKESIKSFARFVLVMLSLASAHYSGFMTQVPFEMVSVVAVDFLSEFIAVFVFYFVMCYTIAKVFAFSLSQFIVSCFHTITALVLRLKNRWPVLLTRSSARMYKDSVRLEGVIYGFFLVLGMYILFDFCYLRVEYSRVGGSVWFFAICMVIAFLLKIGFGARTPKVALGRLRDKKRIALRRLFFKSFTYFAAGFLMGFSFYLGYLRFDKVVDEDAVSIESKVFSGMATILMKSGESFLLLDGSADVETFYYVNDKFSVRLQDGKSKKAEPVESVSLKW